MFVKLFISWVIIFSFLLLPLEILSGYFIERNLNKGVRGVYVDKENAQYLDYIKKIHHVRDIVQWSSFTGNLDKENNLLFSKINYNLKKNRNNILLINGDSWAEMSFWKRGSKKILTDYSNEKQVPIIAAGISSFSVSPMTIQLRLLRNDFNIYPENIISFFDYTDFGDELCRYKNKLNFKGNNLISINPETYESKEVYSDLLLLNNKFNIFYNENYYNLEKILYYAIEKIKFEFTNKKYPMKCGWSNIVSPLINGLDDKDLEHIRITVKNYFNEVFNDSKINKLFIVLHPHRNHFYDNNKKDKYKLLWKPIINDIVKDYNYKDRIIIIDFMDYYPKIYNEQEIITQDIFIKTDISSHLIDKAHSIMLDKILEKVKQH